MPAPIVINIILNWNSAVDTIRLLSLLSQQTYQNCRTIVIDNKSTDGSVKTLSPHTSSVKFIQNKKNLGYAGGNNVGIQIALLEHADYVWILNPDICPTPEALAVLVNDMEQNPSIGAIGPRICFIDNPSKIYSDGGFIFPEKGFLAKHKNHHRHINEVVENYMSEVDYANGSAVLIRTRTLSDIGLLREDFFLYYEETEWCLRAKRRGWRIVSDTEAVVYHRSSSKGFRYHFFMARNRIFLAKVFNQYRFQTVLTELMQLKYLISKPFFLNLFFLTIRVVGIFCGLIKSSRENAKHSVSWTLK